jgi:hypothetical protein
VTAADLWAHTAKAAARTLPKLDPTLAALEAEREHEEADPYADTDDRACPTCNGRGWVPDRRLPLTRNERCPDCDGSRTGRAS